MIKTAAADNLVALLQQPKTNTDDVTDVSTTVVNTCPVTQFIAKEDIALTLGDLRKKSAQGKLWGGEKDRSLAGLHRRLTRYGIAKELGQQHQEGVRQEISNGVGPAMDDTTQAAIAATILESNTNIANVLAQLQKDNKTFMKSMNDFRSSLKKSAFKK